MTMAKRLRVFSDIMKKLPESLYPVSGRLACIPY